MKKSIIALAVATASMATVAQADNTTLYGSIRMAYTYDSEGYTTKAGKIKSTSEFADYGSRIGIKGSDDLGNGLSAFYKYENRVGSGTATTKYLYAGLKGGFGSISAGNQLAPRDNLSNFSDPSNLLEAGYGRDAFTTASNSFAYVTPDMGGFTVAAAIVANGKTSWTDAQWAAKTAAAAAGDKDAQAEIDAQNADNRHVDGYDILAQYEGYGVYAGLGYQSTNVANGNDTSNIGLGLGYGNDTFDVGLLVERKDVDNSDNNPLFARLGGSYNVTDMDKIYASVSMYDSDIDNADEVWGGLLGYQHKFSKRTRVWAEYGYRGETAKDADDESNKFALGLRTDF